MVYRVADIIHDVHIAIDQNEESLPLLTDGDPDALTLDELIQSKIAESVDTVHAAAPAHLLERGHNLDTAVYWHELESGHIILPRDFLRLVVFRMDDWEQPVHKPITTDDPLFARQHSRIKALRGTPQRPVVVINTRPEGNVLEFYSCKTRDAQPSQAVYIPRAVIDDHGGIDISQRCYPAVVHTIAAHTLLACGEQEKAATHLELSKTTLQQ